MSYAEEIPATNEGTSEATAETAASKEVKVLYPSELMTREQARAFLIQTKGKYQIEEQLDALFAQNGVPVENADETVMKIRRGVLNDIQDSRTPFRPKAPRIMRDDSYRDAVYRADIIGEYVPKKQY